MKPLKTIILILVLLVVAIVLYVFGIALRDAQTGGVESETQTTDTVSLFYYSSEKDQDPTGNIMCSKTGLVAVERQIPLRGDIEQDIETVIKILLAGELTSQEKEEYGITTEYPLSGFTLEDVELTNGAATLTFNDSENKTVGGSCRVGILWFQIAETTLQFEGVESVHFFPEELFQP